MQSHQKYVRLVHSGVEESLSKIAAKISDGSVVLDIGCGAGMLGRYLTREKNCIVDGVDSDAAAIEISQPSYRFTAVKNLETESLLDVFQRHAYDYVVIADVLEHLAKPDRLLSDLKELVKPQGVILFSVPNITHISVALNLLFGKFEYKGNGLLDETHLRFYTRQSLLDKLQSFGLHAWEIDTIEKDISETEFSEQLSGVFPKDWINALSSYREDTLTYQWLVSARVDPPRAPNQNQKCIQPSPTRKPSLLFASELYWTDEKNPVPTDDRKLIGHSSSNGDLVTIEFLFSEGNYADGLSEIRIDPVSERKPFFIVSADIRDQFNEVVWTWNQENSHNQFFGAKLIASVDAVGSLFQAVNDDPQWFPVIDKGVLSRITSGWIFRLVLRTDNTLLFPFKEKIIFECLYDELLAKRDELLTKRDQQIADLHSKEEELHSKAGELQAISEGLRDEIRTLQASRSWRITKPLRYAGKYCRIINRLVYGYREYKKKYPGASGLLRLTSRSLDALRRGGVRGLKEAILSHEYQRENLTLPNRGHQFKHDVLMLQDASATEVAIPESVAVHAHVYYPDMATDIRRYLQSVPGKFHLYITTDTAEKSELMEKVFGGLENLESLEIILVENVGKDIYPMLVGVGEKLMQHELVLHIHTKQSSNDMWELAGWRRYLFESVLGNSQRVKAIFQQFIQDEKLGILFPYYHHAARPFINSPGGANDEDMEKMLARSGRNGGPINDVDPTFYPAGRMFWFRSKAIRPFIDMALGAHDFDGDSEQSDGKAVRTIEHMFPYFAREMGLTSRAFLPESFLSEKCTASKLDLLRVYLERGYIVAPTILFDHNGGGGTMTFTRDLVKKAVTTDKCVLRIYCQDAIWFIHWIGKEDGMLFYTNSFDQLFDELSSSEATSVIVNSVYGYLDVPAAIKKIISLAASLNVPLDVKMHDFYPVCPSPHLMDFQGKYCGVPDDLHVCDHCLKKNLGWYHSWYPVENRAVHISEWRKPFSDLFNAATTLTFFDESSIAILAKAFSFDESKARVVPHSSQYFQCENVLMVNEPLHIATLGVLSIPKGGEVVNSLYRYIKAENLDIPVTVLGVSAFEPASGMRIYGPYNNSDLPQIIKKEKINLIFISSIVPETFSYTLSEAMKMGLPVVAFDIGAQGNRVKQYALGKTVPLGSSPEMILTAMRSILGTAKENNQC